MTDERKVLNELISIFKVKDIDFLGFPITTENPLQYHHIIFRKDGGKTTIDNGVPLTSSAHSFFHIMVRKDYITAKKITREFKKLNDSKTPPDSIYYETIKKYLQEYQDKLKNKKYIRERVK